MENTRQFIKIKNKDDYNLVTERLKEHNTRPYGGRQNYPSVSGTDKILLENGIWHWSSQEGNTISVNEFLNQKS